MYIPLKVTTDYSFLKSLIKVDTLISFLNEKNIKVCGICDENLYGVIEFYKKCKENGIKPLIGLDILVEDLHLYLYACNYEGYKNLLKIHTLKEENKLDIEGIKKYSENILAIIPYKSISLYDKLSFFKHIYISYEKRTELESALLITKNVVYLKDIRALTSKEVKYLNYLDQIRKDESKDYTNASFSVDENIDYGCINEVVSLINIEMPDRKRHIPKYDEGIDSHEFLKALAIKGLKKRLSNNVSNEYKDRLSYELNVIHNMGFDDYFLIVYDYVLYAKKNNILVGPGRGSAAGSLVSFAIGITEVDPLKYDLLFERFLNPDRITMPDIDIDFDASKREEVINYVRKRYGEKKVALAMTFNTLKSKLVLREVGKILKIDSTLIDKFLKYIDAKLSLGANLENLKVKKFLDNYLELKNLYEVCMHLEGLKKNPSIHAAAVIISNDDFDEVIPVHMENNLLVTGVVASYLEDLGFLKMDFLALKNLTTIANITKNIKDLNINKIDLNCMEVYDLISSGKTEGIFQFETSLMKEMAMKIKPKSFMDLVDAIALGRPGPKEYAEEYIAVRMGRKPASYINPSLEPILKSTNGVLIYQEQIMKILKVVAGYSYAEADIIRRAIAKKSSKVLREEKEKFVKRSVKNGYKEEAAAKIYDLIYAFASFGFNKSHSVAYAMISYEMAYLKTFYPILFFIENLNSSNDEDKNNEYLRYLKLKGIRVYKADVNKSFKGYRYNERSIIMPLKRIKNISEEIASRIIDVRNDGFEDFFDFCYKTRDFMNKDLLNVLIKASALDSFGLNKNTLINNINSALMYSEIQTDELLIEKPLIVEYPEFDDNTLRDFEYSSYGFYVSNHPTTKFLKKGSTLATNFNAFLHKRVNAILMIERIKIITTKKGEEMAFVSASDSTMEVELTVFPKTMNSLKNIKEKAIVEVNISVEKRFDKLSLIVNNIKEVVS